MQIISCERSAFEIKVSLLDLLTLLIILCSQLVRLCNEGARKMERTEMMYTINSQLEFKIKVFSYFFINRFIAALAYVLCK